MTGRIIDADADALANIDRLTAQVETLKREVDQYEAQLQLERREGRELGLMYAGSNERLQESLTACEQERDATLHRVTVLEGAINGAKSELSNGEHEEAWKTLERVEKCSICSKSFTDCACTAEQKMQAWMDWYREVTTTTEVAEVVAPPAETPAPTCKHGIVEIGVCLSCIERDRLRAELAAANEEIARMHASMKLIRDAAKQALDDRDAFHAKLGRAVAALRIEREHGTHDCGDCAKERAARDAGVSFACRELAEIDAILAAADGTQAAEYVSELEAVYKAAKAVSEYRCVDAPKQRELAKALAAVDARRGGGR